MAVKIRLQRHGKKNNVFFHLVVADSRAPRDGAFIEKLGVYNPNTNPATVDINFDSTITWLQAGAVPTNTCNAILSYKGILLKKHLLDGVKKGALTEEQVEKKFATWLQEKEAKINSKKDNLSGSEKTALAKRLELEKAAKEAKAAKVAAKVAPVAEAAPATEEATPSAEAEAPATEA
jgi:small subunit ribosomal protein S16